MDSQISCLLLLEMLFTTLAKMVVTIILTFTTRVITQIIMGLSSGDPKKSIHTNTFRFRYKKRDGEKRNTCYPLMFSLFLIIKFWSERNARKFDEIDVLVFKFKLLWVGAIRGFASLFVSWNF